MQHCYSTVVVTADPRSVFIKRWWYLLGVGELLAIRRRQVNTKFPLVYIMKFFEFLSTVGCGVMVNIGRSQIRLVPTGSGFNSPYPSFLQFFAA